MIDSMATAKPIQRIQKFKSLLVALMAVFVGMVLIASSSRPVSAYVLQGAHLLELMAKNVGSARQLKVSQRLVLYEQAVVEEGTVVPEVLRYRFPDQFRSDINADHIQRIHVVTPADDVAIVDGRISAEAGAWFDSYKDVVLYRSRRLMLERLILLGVDVQVSSVGRFGDEIVYIIGAQYPDETVPQLWLEKETFRPVRFLVARNTLEKSNLILDIRYHNWRQLGKLWYPMHVEFFQNEVKLREIHVEETSINPGFAEDLFDIAHLRAVYRDPDATDGQPEEWDEMSEIRKAIEEFKNIYE